jgi:hypothetical protein
MQTADSTTYLVLKQVSVLQNGEFVCFSTNFVLEHFFMNGMMCVRVKVVIFAGSTVYILLVVIVIVIVAGFVPT